jgi:DNA-binding FadR family transcriptional regulator
LAELRRAIEPLAAELAAARATEEQIEEMSRCLASMRATIDKRGAFIEADVSFHAAVAAASGNLLFDRLGAMYQPLLGASFALQGKLRSREMVVSATLPQHTAVFEAIAARDVKAARDSMTALVEAASVEVSRIPWDRLTESAAGSS